MDEFKNVTLVKAAIAGAYGKEMKACAKDWVVRNLVKGKQIPVSLSELFEAYHDLDIVFASEFVKRQDWYVIWKIGSSYDEYKDKNLFFVRVLLELLTTEIDALIKEHVQSWLCANIKNPKSAFILLEKVYKKPELMDWSLSYLKGFKEFPDATNMLALIKRIAVTYPEYMSSAVRLIACVAQSGRGYHVNAVKLLAELTSIKNLNEEQTTFLDDAIARQLDAMDIVDLRRTLYESILSPVHRIAIGTRIVHRGYWDNKIIADIASIYNLAFAQSENYAKFVEVWREFVEVVYKYHNDNASELFLALSDAIGGYVEKMKWDVSLMEWNPGMNFQNYSPEFEDMTIMSLNYATTCKQFRPRAFLTALNVWVFDTSGLYDDKWFEQFVSKLPQNHDKSMTWDDDLQKLFEHLSMLYRYRIEIQGENALFIVKQAKLFVQMLVSNYALNSIQITQMRNLCVRLHLDVNVDWEVSVMDKRIEKIAREKEQEMQYLMQLFA